jgi:methyl-accepting chemotaxis protein
VTECDPNGKITFINNRNEEVLGDPKEKIVGKLHSDLDLEAKTNPEKYNQFWDKLLNGIPQQREFSLKVNGKLVWISEHYTPIEDSNGKVVKIINIGIDISKGKNAETLLQKQVEELSKQLRSK